MTYLSHPAFEKILEQQGLFMYISQKDEMYKAIPKISTISSLSVQSATDYLFELPK